MTNEPATSAFRPVQIAITALITALVTVITTLFVKDRWNSHSHRLSFTSAAFACERDTHRVPVLGIVTRRARVNHYAVCITNSGSSPQEQIEVAVAGIGSIAQAVPDGRVLPRTRSGADLTDFSDFLDKDRIDFIVPRLMPGETYFFMFVAEPVSFAAPIVTISSSTSPAEWSPPADGWLATVQLLMAAVFLGSDSAPAQLKQLSWVPGGQFVLR